MKRKEQYEYRNSIILSLRLTSQDANRCYNLWKTSLTLLGQYRYLTTTNWCMSFDVKSLFTSIPLQLALQRTESATRQSSVNLPVVFHGSIGTLRYTTARCYYGYFGRDGLGWQWCFIRQSQVIKILLYGNGMCSLYESLQKWLLSRKPEIIQRSNEIGLTNDIDFLLLPSHAF